MKKHEALLALLSTILACDCIDQSMRLRAIDLKRRCYRDIYGAVIGDMIADGF